MVTREPAVATVTVNPALDVTLTVDRLVADTKLPVTAHRRDPGGGGINVSRMLARLGVASKAVVLAGGPVGDELLAGISADDPTQLIQVAALPASDNTRENVSVIVSSASDQYRRVVPGPPVADPEALIDLVVEAVGQTRFVMLSGGLAPGLAPSFYRLLAGRLSDRTVVVDALEPATVAQAFAGGAEVVKPNEHELASLVDTGAGSVVELAAAARAALDRGRVGVAVVSLGPRGALVVPRVGGAVWLAAPPVCVRSTTGAGDSMVAGIVAGLAGGQSVAMAARLGVAAGAATVEMGGTQLGERGRIEQLLSLIEETTIDE